MKKYLNLIVSGLIAALIGVVPAHQVVQAASISGKKTSKSVLHVKLKNPTGVSLQNNSFVSSKGNDVSGVNKVVSAKNTKRKDKLFRSTTSSDLSGYYRIVLNDNQNIDAVIRALKQDLNVSEAYAEPLPAPAPTTPNFMPLQAHFTAAPAGLSTASAGTFAGGLGDYVRVADLEYSWNTSHEDISDARQTDTLIANGTPVDPFNDTNHGTSVTGLLNGDVNSFGVKGIVPNSKLHLVNTYNAEFGWDIPNAIATATSRLSAGDVMLIEQQAWAPDGVSFAPIEWVPAVYDAIKVATAKGINVIEPAGNGNQNLNGPDYGSSFPMGKPDSGAIIVGAGRACSGTGSHSRTYSSNYGTRVNVQGHGECVATAGYGDLSAGSQNTLYTGNFNGTSSASALVAGVVGSVSSAHRIKFLTNLTPVQMRSLLAKYGTPQDATINPGNIGPLPNLDASIKSFSSPKPDTVPPSIPTKLTGTVSSNTRVKLNWKASTDNSGQTISYKIYRNNVLIATTTSLTYTDTKTARKTNYSYKVRAVDSAGNVSGYSNIISIKTR